MSVATANSSTRFIDQLDNDENITAVGVCAGTYVNSIQLITNKGERPVRGGPGGACTTSALDSGERIVRISGQAGAAINQIAFQTSAGRTIGPFGRTGGKPFSMLVTGGGTPQLRGWFGTVGTVFGVQLLAQLNVLNSSAGEGSGDAFIDRIKTDQTVTAATICYNTNAMANSIQLTTNLGNLPKRGAAVAGELCNTYRFAAAERITELFGRSGQYIDALGFRTNTGAQFGPFGGPGGTGFSESQDTKQAFVGLYGSANTWLSRIGLITPVQGNTDDLALFADQLPAGERISHVDVCTGTSNGLTVVRALQARYRDGSKALPTHGATAKTNRVCTTIAFNDGEFITEITGRASDMLNSVRFRTNQARQFGPYGGTEGDEFLVRNPVPRAFLGFAGHAEYGNTGNDGYMKAIDAAAPDTFEIAPAPTLTAATKGWWDSVTDWPLIAIHAVVIPGGRVMSYGTDAAGTQGAQFVYDVWDPSPTPGMPPHYTLDNTTGTDLFCSSQTLLPNGQVFVTGGDNRQAGGFNLGINNTTIFNPTTNTVTASTSMAYARWYGSQVTLPSGRLLVVGGIDEANGFSVIPEIRNTNGSWSKISNVEIGNDLSYPRLLVGPQLATNVESVYILAGVGHRSVYRLDLPAAGTEGTLVDTGTRLSGATSWERPLARVNATQTLVQLDSGATELLTLPTTSTSKPSVTSAGRMSQARPWSNFTVLPTGDVLANGGSGEPEKLVKVAYHAELWSAKTKTWTTMASELRPRLYHSSAVLLADGRVQSMGGGAPGPVLGTNAQMYSPSYLFKADGSASVRPKLDVVPSVLNVGSTTQTLTVGDATTIKRVTLVKTSSVTHSYNTEQRFLELGFTQVNPTTVRLTAPANVATATPGYYWLSVINAAGVPSVSKLVSVQ